MQLPRATRLIAQLSLAAVLFGCSAESYSGDRSGGALRGAEGGAGGQQPPLPPQLHDDGQGDVWITDAAAPNEPPPLPPQPNAPVLDAGQAPVAQPDAEVAEPQTPVEEPFCPPIPAEWLAPGNAGDGTTSGCAPKICQGTAPLTPDELSRMSDPTLPALGPERYEGCTQIDGDIVISNYGGTDLSELSCLEYVNGTLLIWTNRELTSLHGLESLRFVSADLRIGWADSFQFANDKLTTLAALEALEAIGGSLIVHGTPLTGLEGLEALRAVGADVQLAMPWSMRDLRGLSGLERIGRHLALWRYEGPTTLEGLDALRSLGGNFYLLRADKLVDSPGALPNVTCIGGSLDFSGYDDWAPNSSLVHATFLPQLERVGGDVILNMQPELRTFTILQNVTHIGGRLIVHQNPQLTTLPLPALQQLWGVDVTDNPLLDGCPLLELGTALGAALTRVADNADGCTKW